MGSLTIDICKFGRWNGKGKGNEFWRLFSEINLCLIVIVCSMCVFDTFINWSKSV